MLLKNKLKLISLILLSSALIAAGFFSFNIYKKRQKWLGLKQDLEKRAGNFKGEVSLVIKDLDSGWRISLNEDTLIPSASLVKIPVLLSCFYAAKEKKINLKDAIAIKPSQIVAGSKFIGNYPRGKKFKTEELFDPMITISDNTAANALIELLGYDTLNQYFKKMGLKNTNIARNMMDFESRSAGRENYTTAADMAYILEKLYRGKFLNREISEKCLIILSQQKVNDRIPKKLPKDEIIAAHKTGLEQHICHDVGIVYTPKGNFLICVLVKHRDKFANRAKRFISDVALSVYSYYQVSD